MFKDIIINKSESDIVFYNNIESIMYDVFHNCERRRRLYSCKAEIREYKDFLVLVSYCTPIAVYYPYNEALYDCLRIVCGYTATSAKHISKFEKWLAENNHHVQYAVRFKN